MKPNTNIEAPLEPKGVGSTSQPLEEVIANHPFLKGMSPHQCRILGDAAMRAHFDAGEVIFRAGDPANRFYLIRTGKVAIESPSKNRGATRIQTLGPGDVVGWSWLFPPYLWHFNAAAIEPTEAIFIYGTPLREECESDHELGYELIKRMADIMLTRSQATRRRLVELTA